MTAQANTLEGQWRKALEQLKTWNGSRERALGQLNSVNNLAGQLETLHRCRSGGCGPHRRDRHLGVVGERPLCVELLESKLVQAMEKAYACAVKEKRILLEVVQKLKKYAKQGQKIFIDSVDCHELAVMCCRRAENFSAADYLAWLNEMHCSYRADLEENCQQWTHSNTLLIVQHMCVLCGRENLSGPMSLSVQN